PSPKEPNMEELIKYNPDVVFFWNIQEQIDKMSEHGYSVIYSPGETFQSLEAATKGQLRVYAEALGGDALKRADAYDAFSDEKIGMITDATSSIPENARPKVYFARSHPRTACGKNSYISEMVEKAGGAPLTAEDFGFRGDING